MIISWLIYLATAIGCAAFFVFYSDLLALIVLISVLCVPVLLFIIHLTSVLLTKIEVEFDESQMGANKPVNLLIKVTNRSLFAITNIKLTSDFKNLFLNTEHSCKFVINAVPLSTKVFTYRLNSEHVGNVEFTLKKAQFFDFFSMFMLSKKLNNAVAPFLNDSWLWRVFTNVRGIWQTAILYLNNDFDKRIANHI